MVVDRYQADFGEHPYENEQGEYVLYDDYAKLEKELARLEEVNAVNLDSIRQYQGEVKRLRVIYDLANEFMAELGRDGEITIDTQSEFAGKWMNALFDIDGGCPNPQTLKEVDGVSEDDWWDGDSDEEDAGFDGTDGY